jgi:hypothetical protein
MISLIYVSAAKRLLEEQNLSDLLAVSRRNNAARNITGMLCYADGNFMQAIEGEDTAIDTLEQTILADPRHHRMRRLARYPIDHRQFENWSMALNRIGALPAQDRENCTLLMTARLPDLAGDSPKIAVKLLDSFRKTMT